jgi:dipeptide/tripeptide permease
MIYSGILNLQRPKACSYIVPNEFGERFNYYGSKPLFAKYLSRFYGLKNTEITVWTSMNGFLTYFLPLFGAMLSDSYLGKYNTIVSLSVVYALGTIFLAVFSVPGLVPSIPSALNQTEIANLVSSGTPLPGALNNNQVSPFWTFLVPMIMIAIGAGGIKPWYHRLTKRICTRR